MSPVRQGVRRYLRTLAGWTWNRQNEALKLGLTLQEETLTEMLLSRMARDHGKHGLKVTMFNKAEEALNGADWEWIVKTGRCELGLRVQAKRLYHQGKSIDYGGLNPNSKQAANLIARAGTSIPIYVFFNHAHGNNSRLLQGGGEAPYRGRSYWGCSIACAKRVQSSGSNKLSALKPLMRPWHRLISSSGKCEAFSVLGISPPEIETAMPISRREVVERIRDRDFMLEYLQHEDLAGVAILDFSEFRGH